MVHMKQNNFYLKGLNCSTVLQRYLNAVALQFSIYIQRISHCQLINFTIYQFYHKKLWTNLCILYQWWESNYKVGLFAQS